MPKEGEKSMKKEVFRGVGTALITPMRGGKIDHDALGKLIDRQINAGIDAIIIAGTTGEASTLSRGEREELYISAKRAICERATLIFGIGSNNTASAVEYAKIAESVGCDGLLAVTPYYNKGTREGVYKHYEAIAKSTYLPIILYNVPGRTGVDLSHETLLRLATIDNITGIKEAKGSFERLAELILENALSVYTGCDAEMLDILNLGGSGVISVVSNLYPKAVKSLYSTFYSGNKRDAERLFVRLKPIISALFIDTNPAPIKYALARLGLSDEEMRLPMCPIDNEARRTVDEAMDSFVDE